MKENSKEFWRDYSTFCKKAYGHFLSEKVLDEWFDVVQDAHKVIRNKINGISLTKEIHINDKNNYLPLDKNNSFIKLLAKHLPEYFIEYELSQSDLTHPYLRKFKNISTVKHINGYIKRKKISDTSGYIRYCCTGLASSYSASKIITGKYTVDLRTDAMSFIKLGHYGHDKSCFSNDGSNWRHKYKIGIKKNSFVIIIHKDGKISGRCWGFFTPKDEGWHTLNHYIRYLSNATLEKILEIFFESKNINYKELSEINNSEYIYLNCLPDTNKHTISFSQQKLLAIEELPTSERKVVEVNV